jgi:PAS domain S-box-containing protein
MPDQPPEPVRSPVMTASAEVLALRAEVARLTGLLTQAQSSERVEHTRRTDELRRRFELVTHAAGIGHWSLERGAAKAHWSAPLRSLFGLAEQAALPSPAEWFTRWVHPADRATTQTRFARWMRSRQPAVDMSFRVLRADGQVRQVITHSRRESGEPGPLLFGVVIDVTEQRSAELALRGALETAALAARGAGLGTWQLDLSSGVITWDAQMWALRGLSAQTRAPVEEARLALVHPGDRDRARDATRQAIAAGSTLHLEFRVVWPDGQVRWLASRSSQGQDAATGTAKRIGVNWDVTDTRTAAAARQEREIARRESQAQSRFLARMSHELRTPLNAMLGFTQLMLEEDRHELITPTATTRHHRLTHVAAAGAHLLALIDDVLDLSSLQSGELHLHLETLGLAQLVQSTLPLLGPALAAQPVKVHLGPLAHAAQADARRLRQVLLNLLSNAIKYNRPGGEVRVESRREGAEVVLSVSDTGRGMSDEQQLHLFEPFNRLGAESAGIEGTGIGLAIAKSLVERMGGTMAVQSTAGAGSVFELRLKAALDQATADTAMPRAQGDAALRPPTEADAAGVEARCHRVLYIEDNPVNALIITELLARRDDLALEIAVDAASGVAAAQKSLPDLILLDMQLPDADGFEVLRRLRAHPATADIACVALSANAMPEDIARARQAGVADYWTKPLDFKAFMAALDTRLPGPAG